MAIVVGGRPFEQRPEEVEQRMREERPETIRKHVVEMAGTVFPPKQVIATVTGWERTSFTTNEAQRVLTQLGFRCRTAAPAGHGTMGWQIEGGGESLETGGAVVARLVVAEEAIASLVRRVGKLERGPR
jgi:hypothetical protein